MELLKWISFGTWNTPVTNNDLDAIYGFSISFLICLGIKTLGMMHLDWINIRGEAKTWGRIISILVRILLSFIYFLLFCTIGLFHIPILYIGLLAPIIFWLVLFMMFLAEEDYILYFNEAIKDFCASHGRIIRSKIDVKIHCKTINKRIYDYRKTASIR